jgi:DMSO/TMAO reductase YedYZ heme-binding membrane subunit
MTALDLSSYVGLAALYLLTVNLLLGLLLSVRYSPWRQWPHRRFNYFLWHNWSGYIALTLGVLHPILILPSSTAHFSWIDLVYPVGAPKQPWINTLGAAALYLLAVVVVTSYYRREIGRAPWKTIHYLAYAVALLSFVHGILTDPTLTDKPIDLLDGEKVSVELCLILALAATVVRMHGRWRSYTQEREREALRRAA